MAFDGPLGVWLREQGGLLSVEKVSSIVHQTADALQQMHNRQVVYLDVNPFTLLIHAQDADHFEVQLAELSPTRMYAGSGSNYRGNSLLMYTAPEQWVGLAVPATDQYALAVLAYELLTGQPPFQGPPAQLMDLHINIQPAAPGTLNSQVSSAVDAVILSALAKRPEDRFPSISAFASALEQAMHRPEALLVNVPRTTGDSNLRATLLISKAEAEMGTLRTITLPQGRRITVSVPAGAYDGQMLRLEDLGGPSPTGGSPGALILTLAVSPTEPSISHAPTTKKPSSFPASMKSTFSSSSAAATKAYTRVARLPLKYRAIVLAGLALLIVLAGTGLFALVQSNAHVPMPYPPNSGSLALNDLLRDNSGGYDWPEGNNAIGNACQFAQGGYHVSVARAGSFYYCIAGANVFTNFAYEVRMTILRGDEGGIIFRADGANHKFYYFRVGRDGSYGLYSYVDSTGAHARTLVSKMTPAVRTGLNQPNLLAVVAHGTSITLYVNNQRIDSVVDKTYDFGQIGVAAANATSATEVTFSSARVWTIA